MRYALMMLLAACGSESAIGTDGGDEPDAAGSCNLVDTCDIGTPGVGGMFDGQWHVMIGSDCGPLMELDLCFLDGKTRVAVDLTCGVADVGITEAGDWTLRLGKIDAPKCNGETVRVCNLFLAHMPDSPEVIAPGPATTVTYGCDGCTGTATILSGSKTAVDCPNFPP